LNRTLGKPGTRTMRRSTMPSRSPVHGVVI
jgi:hypothetical protein